MMSFKCNGYGRYCTRTESGLDISDVLVFLQPRDESLGTVPDSTETDGRVKQTQTTATRISHTEEVSQCCLLL